jgi:hypothetical protein
MHCGELDLGLQKLAWLEFIQNEKVTQYQKLA